MYDSKNRNRHSHKLSLKKETLRALKEDTLAIVLGGSDSNPSETALHCGTSCYAQSCLTQ